MGVMCQKILPMRSSAALFNSSKYTPGDGSAATGVAPIGGRCPATDWRSFSGIGLYHSDACQDFV
jgi:hypothetical protein